MAGAAAGGRGRRLRLSLLARRLRARPPPRRDAAGRGLARPPAHLAPAHARAARRRGPARNPPAPMSPCNPHRERVEDAHCVVDCMQSRLTHPPSPCLGSARARARARRRRRARCGSATRSSARSSPARSRPGERLRAEALAHRFGTSRTPVREALLSLEAEGLVEIAPHRGAVVRPFDAADLRRAVRAARGDRALRGGARGRADRRRRRSPRWRRTARRRGDAAAPTRAPSTSRSRSTRSSTGSSSAPPRARACEVAMRAVAGHPARVPHRVLARRGASARSRCSATASSCARCARARPGWPRRSMRMHVLGAKEFLIEVVHDDERPDGAAARRPARRRVRPAAGRPLRGHAAGRLRRRRRQGRGAAGGRPDARLGPPAPQRPLAVVVDPGPQQALGHAQPAHARGPGARARGCAPAPTSCWRTSAPARWRSGASGPSDVHAAQPARGLRARVRLRADRAATATGPASPRPARRSAACATSTATPARRRRAAASRSATRSPRSRPSRASCSPSTRATCAARPARWSTPRSPTPASR